MSERGCTKSGPSELLTLGGVKIRRNPPTTFGVILLTGGRKPYGQMEW